MHIFLYDDVKYPFLFFFFWNTHRHSARSKVEVGGGNSGLAGFWQVSEQWRDVVESLHHFQLISRWLPIESAFAGDKRLIKCIVYMWLHRHTGGKKSWWGQETWSAQKWLKYSNDAPVDRSTFQSQWILFWQSSDRDEYRIMVGQTI